MKKNYVNFICGLVLFMAMITGVNAQIHSTTAGGNWGDQSTWVGGAIPGAADDVVINGTVDCNSHPSCNNILIASTGTIRNDWYSGSLTVNGNITNNGSIQNWSSGLTLYIKGDIINNGNWSAYYTRPNGTEDQTITCLNGNYFAGNQFHNQKVSGNIYFNGTVNFENCDVYLDNADVFLQANSTLNLHNGQFRNCNLLGSGSTSVVFAEGVYNVDATTIQYVSFNNLSLDGEITLYTGCSMHGTVINNGTLQNDYFSTSTDLYDEFINNGTITDYSSGLALEIYGNFTNNHVVENYYMNFRGDTDQQVSLMAGKTFSPNYFQSLKSSGSIIALTDLYFDHTIINMNSDELFLPDGGTISLSGGYLTNVILNDANNASGYLHLQMSDEAYLDYSTVYSPEIIGNGDMGADNTFIGEVLVTGNMQNDYYGYTLTIDGNIINNGIIQNNSSGFTLNINGNIQNNGIWQNYYTVLNGVTDQHVTCLNNSTFSGYQFISSKSSGLVYFDDEVNFENVQILFQGNQLELPQNSTLVLHKGYLLDCNLHGNGSTSVVHGEGTYASEGHFLQTSSFENVRFTGEWAFSNNIELNGTILNDGILQNAYFSNSVEVFANFINNGTIRNYVGGITMKMYGDFTNNGIWKGHAIDLHGSGDQNIELADNMIFEPTYFTSFKPSGHIISTNDLEFRNTLISMNNTPLILPEQGTLRISGQYMQHADIMAQSGRFNLVTSNAAFLHSCQFQNVTLYGDIYLQDNSFNGTTINYGTMQNNYYAFTANFYGDLINYGTIQHYASAFIINAHADIVNNGNWNNIYTRMVGTSDQYIHLNNGHEINGEMYLLSDLSGSSYQWYFNTWAISTFFPDPDPFSGYTSMELKFNVPVAAPWAGEYKCWVDGNFSRKIIVDYTTTPQLDLTAMLEGPFNNSEMNTDLNGMIPHQQSLGIIGYGGPETVTGIPNGDIVDWIGLELRDAPDAASATEATTIAGGAYFLLKDGSIVGLDGYSMPSFDITINNQLFVVIWHRNHLPVMSAYPLTETGGIYTYDFTTAASQAYGDNQSDLGGGYFGMIGGNANADGEIDQLDGTEYWMPEVGQAGYLQSDVNMDGQVDNKDKNDIWYKNLGKDVVLPW